MNCHDLKTKYVAILKSCDDFNVPCVCGIKLLKPLQELLRLLHLEYIDALFALVVSNNLCNSLVLFLQKNGFVPSNIAMI